MGTPAIVSGASAGLNGMYVLNAAGGYTQANGLGLLTPGDEQEWTLTSGGATVYYSSSTGNAHSPPWDCTYNGVTVTQGGPVQTDANWAVLRNTVELTVQNDSATAMTVNGVNVAASTTVNIGWVDPQNLALATPATGGVGASVEYAAYANGLVNVNLTMSLNGLTGPLAFPIPVPSRCTTVTIYFAGGDGG